MKRSEIERTVRGCDLFKGLAKTNVSKIAGLCHVETYEAGDTADGRGLRAPDGKDWFLRLLP